MRDARKVCQRTEAAKKKESKMSHIKMWDAVKRIIWFVLRCAKLREYVGLNGLYCDVLCCISHMTPAAPVTAHNQHAEIQDRG